MVSDRDIWRKARAYIEQYCDQALAQAEKRAEALLAEGDLDGQRVWNRVLATIIEIRGAVPGRVKVSAKANQSKVDAAEVFALVR